MKLKTILAFVGAAGLSVMGASVSATWIEERSEDAVKSSLLLSGYDWTDVTTDGLQVRLSGEAPDEATRFRVVSQVGRAIDPDRIIDLMDIKARAQIQPPSFSVEILRNGDGISLIGLIPSSVDRGEIATELERLSGDGDVTDMLETADYPVPEGWTTALDYALNALRDLPKSKISVTSERVEITAISDSAEAKRKIERDLNRQAPDLIDVALDISAPRPVITPFTLRVTLAEEGARFDACSAPNQRSRARILEAAAAAGVPADADCRIGLGVPSPRWAEAVETALASLKDMGGGSLTFSDADVTLVATDSTNQSVFDRVAGELDANLPDVFSLHAVLPEKVIVDGTGDDESAIEFVATRSPEGLVQLRGRLTDDSIEQIVGAYARAEFGTDAVYLATREDPDLPQNWAVRVLAALESLGTLNNGSAVVQPDYVEIRGVSGSKTSTDDISRILADKLGESENFEVNVRYDELLDETLNIPTPEECVERINRILSLSKIAFEPASAEITESAAQTIDKIAEIAQQCGRVQMEIGGHTDSQGREIMNLELSQERANSVLAALLERRVSTRNLTARGYGETVPIADNKTEEGREINRRIEVRLLTDARLAATEDDAPEDGEAPAPNDAEATAEEDASETTDASDETAEPTEPTEDTSEQN
ncbi:OmpA family protein [Litoreibacter roseus]|uniref:Membrane protein n=1 Tax=Litoreibacter roseus TaxID=2601869 RepID=A0A6N6JEP6_9RHOB|nr:OmpA family protein [Litoreibacter roseus]GFE64823.1 membrane protein [Litoreibacter roseus]